MAHLRSRLNSDETNALAHYLNRNLPESRRFSEETVGRWEKGKQGMRDSNVPKLAREIGVNEFELRQYIKGKLPLDRITKAIDANEIPVDEAQIAGEILRLMRKLSPLFLVEVMSKAWDILQGTMRTITHLPARSTPATIAALTQSHQDECIEMFDGIIDQPETRVRAIASGQRPDDAELELISNVTGVSVEELYRMRKEEFGNGTSGTNHPSCVGDR